MTIPKFIEDAIEGGWRYESIFGGAYPCCPHGISAITVSGYSRKRIYLQRTRKDGMGGRDVDIGSLEEMLLDPSAWQAVGKVEGWGSRNFRELTWSKLTKSAQDLANQDAALHRFSEMPRALWHGKTIEQYLETL